MLMQNSDSIGKFRIGILVLTQGFLLSNSLSASPTFAENKKIKVILSSKKMSVESNYSTIVISTVNKVDETKSKKIVLKNVPQDISLTALSGANLIVVGPDLMKSDFVT